VAGDRRPRSRHAPPRGPGRRRPWRAAASSRPAQIWLTDPTGTLAAGPMAVYDELATAHRARALSRSDRLAVILRRDGFECVWCRRTVAGPDDPRPGRARLQATTDHLIPKLKGGPSWIENEVAACSRCNRSRGHRSPSAWLEDCERLGLTPNREAITRCLSALGAAIETTGGQRRARPYLAAQLRRLVKP
jgi:hypothetical protein